ncbi:hypothetical protein CI610_00467 [invertebrate metagenome]|uniref:EamA domain-containing protein n=1 Tax=invertebrate metagenome TaxID=1711999 RepID=A0A2H9TBF1_9ZZZZ
MFYLVVVTLLWSFSFSLIGVYLAGQVDPYFSVFSRVLLAFLVFLPFLRLNSVPLRTAVPIMGTGAIQLGLMYLCYYQSFALLSVPEILLFTVMTPIYITLIYDILKRRFSPWYLLTAFLAVAGAVIIQYHGIRPGYIKGFILVQGANICMAIGQVGYKKLMEKEEHRHIPLQHTFGLFYLGALLVASIAMLLLGDVNQMPSTALQWIILLWLGVVASGAGYFLWNKGACMVNAGALAIMNNALVPVGLVVNLVIWNHEANLVRLSLGGSVILLSLLVNEWLVKKRQLA